jgi:hypothetical protein
LLLLLSLNYKTFYKLENEKEISKKYKENGKNIAINPFKSRLIIYSNKNFFKLMKELNYIESGNRNIILHVINNTDIYNNY